MANGILNMTKIRILLKISGVTSDCVADCNTHYLHGNDDLYKLANEQEIMIFKVGSRPNKKSVKENYLNLS